MARIPQRTIDLIITTADIVEVVNEFIPLKRRGTNFWGLSPFKREKTPSFAVSPSKNIFKDFSSGTGGNVVSFLMETQGMSYVEALKYLAKKYGIEIPEDARGEGEDDATQKRRDALLGINKFAAQFFTSQLMESEEGRQRAGTYLDGRGFDGPTRQLFQLGYSPEAWEALTQAAVKRGYKAEDLQELGLSILSEKTGRPFDRFRSRLIFPLHDAGGQIIGFAGRILDKDAKGAKYVNSPESVLYDKSRFLYGLYFAKQSIREEKEAILVEGYTDVIGLYQAGVKNAVASSGTSLTEPQIALLKRHCDKLLVLFDGDAAGVKASLRGIGLLVQAGMHVRVLPLPPEHDPDSFIREHGAKGFREYAKTHAVDFLRFMVDALADGRSLEDPNVQGEVLETVADTLARIPDEVQRGLLTAHAARLVGTSEEIVAMAIGKAAQTVAREHAHTRRTDLQTTVAQKLLPAAQLAIRRNLDDPAEYLGPQEREFTRIFLNFFDYSFTEEEGTFRLLDVLHDELEEFAFFVRRYEIIRTACFHAYREGRDRPPLQTLMNESEEAVKEAVLELMSDHPELSAKNLKFYHERDLVKDYNIREVMERSLNLYKLKRIEVLIEENRLHFEGSEDDAERQQIQDVNLKLASIKNSLGKELGYVVMPKGFHHFAKLKESYYHDIPAVG